jgi:hypothetical protein
VGFAFQQPVQFSALPEMGSDDVAGVEEKHPDRKQTCGQDVFIL